MTDILVVDDEAAVCRVVELVLGRQGYALTSCTNGLAAVDLISRRDFAIALVDLNLRDVDGRQVIRAARAARPELPIVVMSGLMAESGRSPSNFLGISIRIGGLYRLAKPFKPKDLLDLVADILTAPPRSTKIPGRTRIAS